MSRISFIRRIFHSVIPYQLNFRAMQPLELEKLSTLCAQILGHAHLLNVDVTTHLERAGNARKREFHHVLIGLSHALEKQLSELNLQIQARINPLASPPNLQMDFKNCLAKTIGELLLTYEEMRSYELPIEFTELTLTDRVLTRKTTSTISSYFIQLKDNILKQFIIRINEILNIKELVAPFFDQPTPIGLLNRAPIPNSAFSDLLKNPATLVEMFTDPLQPYYLAWLKATYPTVQFPSLANPERVAFQFGLTNLPRDNDKFRMTIIGCHGMDGSFMAAMKDRYINEHPDAQLAVARGLRASEPDVNLQLGDNVYYDGLPFFTDTPNLKYFQHNQELYGRTASFKPIANWILPGNHDYGFWGHADKSERLDPLLKSQTHLQRIFNQVFHTFAVNDHWNMPHRYYLLNHEHFFLFMLDTNTLIFDQYQQKWFVDTLLQLKANFPRKWIIVAGHHPLFYLDKAEQDCEWHKYYKLMEARGHKVDKLGLYKKSEDCFIAIDEPQPKTSHEFNHMGKFLVTLIRTNKLPIDLWFCAHEHIMAKVNATFHFGIDAQSKATTHEICQLTSGGGGAQLRDIRFSPISSEFLKSYEHAAVTLIRSDFYARLHGFMELSITANVISWRPHLFGWEGKLPKKSDQFHDPHNFSTDENTIDICVRGP